MTEKQLIRLEVLSSMEFMTPDEHDEHANLLRLESTSRAAEERAKEEANWLKALNA